MSAARRCADRAAILLRARHPVGKAIIGGDVIYLCGRLVVPTAPRLRAILCDDCALIASENHPVRIIRVNPELMIVVAAGRALNRRPGFARVGRAIERSVRDVDRVRVLRVNDRLAEVPAAAPYARVVRDERPSLARVVRAVESAGLRVNDCVDAVSIGRRDGESDATETFNRYAVRQLHPSRAAVG